MFAFAEKVSTGKVTLWHTRTGCEAEAGMAGEPNRQRISRPETLQTMSGASTAGLALHRMDRFPMPQKINKKLP